MDENCIFCKIVNGIIPSFKIYEDKDYIAFLDIMPATKGHSLVIPKKHYLDFLNIPPKELTSLVLLTQRIANGVVKAVDANGYKIEMFNGVSSGQTIPHAHFHIIPRYIDDKIEFKADKNYWIGKKDFYKEGEASELIKKIKSFL